MDVQSQRLWTILDERWRCCWHTLVEALVVHLVDGGKGMGGGGAGGMPSSTAIYK